MAPTVDRIDNRLGYVKGNIEVISYKANRIKGHLTVSEIEMLLKYMKERSQT